MGMLEGKVVGEVMAIKIAEIGAQGEERTFTIISMDEAGNVATCKGSYGYMLDDGTIFDGDVRNTDLEKALPIIKETGVVKAFSMVRGHFKSKDGKDFIIELVNGSKLIFFSVEQTHTIRGFTLDYLIWDEVSHSREYTPDGEHIYYNIVAPLLDAKGKTQIFISTPNGAQGFFYNEAVKGMNGERGYAYYKVSIYDDETKDVSFANNPHFLKGVMVHPQAPDWYVDTVRSFCDNHLLPFEGKSKLYS